MLAVEHGGCNSQAWVSAFDEDGTIIWADRIHRCGGTPVLVVGPSANVWVLTKVTQGATPLLRRYAPG